MRGAPRAGVGGLVQSESVPVDFTAIDFETANASSASACAVGLVRVRGGEVVARTGWLIRPPAGLDHFAPVNVSIHGIRPADVADAPTWDEQLDRLCAFAGSDVLLAHNAGFDMSVLRRACATTGVETPPYRYACTVQIARATYRLASYRLPLAAAAAGFTGFRHHDAVADAEACAHIAMDAARLHGADSIEALALAARVGVKRVTPLEQPVAAVA